MRKRQIKVSLSCALILCLCLACLPATAYAVTQDDIQALKDERNAISAQREEKQAVVDELEAEQAGVLEQKLALDERNMLMMQEIQNIGDEIELYNQMIEEKAEEVEEAKRQELQQLERYRTRVRAMEEDGDISFLALILNTSNLGDLLAAIDDVGDIMESDRNLEEKYIAAREKTEEAKAEYEAVRMELQGQQTELKVEQAELQKEIDDANARMVQLLEDIDLRSAELEELIAAENEADARVDAMIEQYQREHPPVVSSGGGGGSSGGGGGGGAVGTGSFIWPAPSCTYITSRFGWRIHPVTGVGRNHNGLDIGAGYGSSILAADGGTAHTYYDDGGYGYYIMIDHGNGYQTLYGHMSAYAISDGETVSQGQVIGYVGSSGLVTGPHLHFEIWSGGGRIDPEQFFSGLTFAPDAGV